MFSTQIINKTSNLNLSAVSISEKDLCGRLSNMKRRGSSPRIIPLIKKSFWLPLMEREIPEPLWPTVLLCATTPVAISTLCSIIRGLNYLWLWKKKVAFFHSPLIFFIPLQKKSFTRAFPVSPVFGKSGVSRTLNTARNDGIDGMSGIFSRNRAPVPGISIRDWLGIYTYVACTVVFVLFFV